MRPSTAVVQVGWRQYSRKIVLATYTVHIYTYRILRLPGTAGTYTGGNIPFDASNLGPPLGVSSIHVYAEHLFGERFNSPF